MMKSATAVINTAALVHNIQVIRSHVPQSEIWAMVKANAYGHGMIEVARYLAPHVSGFGVARLDEAAKLCSNSVTKPILLLEGFFHLDELIKAIDLSLHTAVHTEEQVVMLEDSALPQPITVWLKLDTGMHRLGFLPEEVPTVVQRLMRCKNVKKPIHFMSHFSCADEKDNPYTLEQLALFERLTAGYEGKKSIAASSGCFNWTTSHYDVVRPGISLYGVSPMNETPAWQLGLKPVMTMTSSLIAVRKAKRGEQVGYGATWTVEKDTYLGVVAMGYGDGYPRCAPYGTPVLVNGRRVPIVGRISMDMLTVDLGLDATDNVGDEVILWGDPLPVEEVAEHIGTIGYELVTTITSRVKLIHTSV